MECERAGARSFAAGPFANRLEFLQENRTTAEVDVESAGRRGDELDVADRAIVKLPAGAAAAVNGDFAACGRGVPRPCRLNPVICFWVRASYRTDAFSEVSLPRFCVRGSRTLSLPTSTVNVQSYLYCSWAYT